MSHFSHDILYSPHLILYILFLGPGSSEQNPASSCRLMQMKFESFPDGNYWLKGRNNKKYCERRGNVFVLPMGGTGGLIGCFRSNHRYSF